MSAIRLLARHKDVSDVPDDNPLMTFPELQREILLLRRFTSFNLECSRLVASMMAPNPTWSIIFHPRYNDSILFSVLNKSHIKRIY